MFIVDSNQPHYIGIIGAYQQRFVIMRFFNRLVGANEPHRPISRSASPYARITTDTLQTIHLVGIRGLRSAEFFCEVLTDLKLLILVDSKTPEAFREVKSILETLRMLERPFVILAKPANHPNSWHEHEMRQALRLESYEFLWMTNIETQEDVQQALSYCINLLL